MRKIINIIIALILFASSKTISQIDVRTIVDQLKVNDEIQGLYNNYHGLPNYAINKNGDFILVWRSNESGQENIVYQLYTKDGIPIGENGKIRINKNFIDPKVFINDDCSFTIFWLVASNTICEVYGQSFKNDFTEINNITKMVEFINPWEGYSVSQNGNDIFTIAWSNFHSFNESDLNKMYFQIFNKNLNPISKKVNFSNKSYSRSPIVTWGKNNDFLVSWIVDSKGYAKYYTNSGMNHTEDILFDDYLSTYSFNPLDVIINDNNGNFLITWEERNSFCSVLFDISNLKVKNYGQLNYENEFLNKSKAIFENNSFYIFLNYENLVNKKIYCQRLSSEGIRLDKEFTIDIEKYNFKIPNLYVAIYIDLSNIYLVSLKQGNNSNIYLQKFSATDSTTFTSTIINEDYSTADQRGTSISADKTNNFKVVWSDNRYQETSNVIFENFDIFIQKFDSLGNFISKNEIVNDDINNANQIYPSIAEVDDGSFMVCWNDFRDNKDIGYPKGQIYAQYFSSDGLKEGENFVVDDKSISVNYPQVFSNNNRFYFFWVDTTVLHGYLIKNSLKLKIYSNKGIKLSEVIQLNDNSNLIIGEKPKLEFNQKGEILLFWKDFSTMEDIVQHLDENGLKINDNISVRDLNLSNDYYSENEQNEIFKIVYQNSKNEIYYQIINPSKKECSSSKLVINKILNCYPRDPQIFLNKDGSFIISWIGDILNNLTEMNIDYSLQFLKYFNENGEPGSDNIILNKTQKTQMESISIFAENNRLFYSYISKNNFSNIYYGMGDIIDSTMVKVIEFNRNITNIEKKNNSIEKFYIAQNYPNPFNPTTKIKYAIPQNEKGEKINVKIIVYDILGKEISTLVNDNKSFGDYEVNFDASNIPSGVYFYKLQAGDYIQSRKMLLIK